MAEVPVVPDPYKALGLPKDVDAETIKKTHRKLVLKYHPDRIKDPTLQEEGKNKFTEVQLAYELLVDPDRRARYDKEVRLAELRREYAAAEAVRAFSNFKSTKSSATPRRESATDTRYNYEDRAPSNSYFENAHPYDDPLPRANARKAETPYERDRKTSGSRSSDKKDSREIPAYAAYHLKAKIAEFRENKQREQLREEARTAHIKKAKMRDQEERREREHKRSQSDQYYFEGSSDDDDDTVVSRSRARNDRRNGERSRMTRSPEPEMRASSPPTRKTYVQDIIDEDDVYQRKHRSADDYINTSRAARPDIYRKDSDARIYKLDRDYEPRAQYSSRSSHRDFLRDDDYDVRPNLPKSKSDRPSLSSMAEETISHKIPLPRHRSSGSTRSPTEPAMDLPQRLRRVDTDPVSPTSGRREPVSRGSTLKTEINHDSGYASGSPAHTPPLRGESPPEKPTRPNIVRETSTTYKINKNTNDDSRTRLREVPTISTSKSRWLDPETSSQYDSSPVEGRSSRRDSSRNRRDSDEIVEPRRRRTSRERARESGSDRERRRSRDRRASIDHHHVSAKDDRPSMMRVETEVRSRSSKHSPVAEDRPSLSRAETESRRTDRSEVGARPSLYREMTPSSRDRSRTYDPVNLKTAKYGEPIRTKHTMSPSSYKPYDEDMRSTVSTGRPSLGRSSSSARVSSRSGIGVR